MFKLKTFKSKPEPQQQSNCTINNDKLKLIHYNNPTLDDMAILLVYFNPCNYIRLSQNALLVKQLFDLAKIPYFIAEITYNDSNYLFEPCDNIFHYSSNSYMFYKDNLIVTMEKKIPNNYTKLCIIDFDILFDNPNWYDIISVKLNSVNVTQPFKTAHFLNADFSICNIKSNCIDKKTTDCINYNLEHTGFLWGFNRIWFNNYKLNDLTITGLGDTIFANNITKRYFNDAISKFYYNISNDLRYQEIVTYDSCDLNIYHLYHGPLQNRQYMSIHKIINDTFKNLNINKMDDILIRRSDNIIEWNPDYRDTFNTIMLNYFTIKNDDCI